MKKVIRAVKNVITVIAGCVVVFLDSYVFCGMVMAFILYLLWQWIERIWEVRQWLF